MSNLENNTTEAGETTTLLCGFRIGKDFYAIPVLEIQEVVKPQVKTPVPLAPDFIDGLINLRGQVVTSINMRKILGINDEATEEKSAEDYMNIIVKSEDGLYALVVDEVLDVMDVKKSSFSETPSTLDEKIKKFIHGVFQMNKNLIILLNLNKLLDMDNQESK